MRRDETAATTSVDVASASFRPSNHQPYRHQHDTNTTPTHQDRIAHDRTHTSTSSDTWRKTLAASQTELQEWVDVFQKLPEL